MKSTGTGFILSFRHLDAVYDIDQASGNILWKLGGSATPQSLRIVNDPVFTSGGGFGGQHDAQLQADGTLTLYDDRDQPRPCPRAVRYRIDTQTHTATMLEQLSDPAVAPSSPFGGSIRSLAGGDWVIGWGGTPAFGEYTSTGTRVFLVQFAPGTAIYRALPVPYGQLSPATLAPTWTSSTRGLRHHTIGP